MLRRTLIITAISLSLYAGQVFSFSVDEAADGDLSGAGPAPTLLHLELGANTLSGSAGGNDYDIFYFSIQPNTVLGSITVNSYQPGSGISFLGMQTDTQWTAGLGSGISGNALTGWTLFGANNIGEDLLPSMANAGQGASGFNLPLGAGEYVFLIQDTGSAINYGLTFTATPVPLPAALPLLALSLVGLSRVKCRRD